ncbi:hypothetical protein Asulf_00924 [Archaeoglobus sulfaticallidus PM70-1]|uniref:ABC transporter domain-containing protein n=1 Tax=Archaeoglobus sulfaticallidus PM70-1 TaxID=387631 RepID=N0BBF3_9EURY|nr:ABC transporter ATP-binding protein [Archaeoglobus sulfaticallidus]AGK60929.1 hypothetical protein Asulf_00924 [Archaeoglobus sulfaticallidus PM70-1]
MLKGVGLYKVFESGFFSKHRIVAVDGVDIEINRGEVLALVGESGSGKSTLGRMLLMLVRPTRGEIYFDGLDLVRMKAGDLRRVRRRMQLIPQHPEDALDPRWRIYDSIAEPLRIHGLDCSRDIIHNLIEMVGLREEHLYRYPHELSGGELQRVVIARAIAVEPEFIVCDEPTSMLDMSVQASIVNLLVSLHKKLGMAYLFITHDLELARIVADRVAVMFAGQIVEEGVDVLDRPLHPYTEMLVRSVEESFELTQRSERSGCKFYSLCPKRMEICSDHPEMVRLGDRKVRCHLFD